MKATELSTGEQRMRIDFNPSSSTAVDHIKRSGAVLIDTIEAAPGDPRCKALAMTAAEEAGMWGVKAATAPRVELNSSDGGPVVLSTLVLPVDTNALQGSTITVEVVPPPDARGFLPALDGRRQRVADVNALARRMNRQALAARIDRDHQSEPISKTFTGTTAAGGWLSDYHPNDRGGISARAELSPEFVDLVRQRKYRYVSPGYLLDRDDNVTGLSSLALVNNPNLPLSLPALHAHRARERALAEQAVDSAVLNGHIEQRGREYHLNAIQSHPDGVQQGVDAFNAFLLAGATAGPGAGKFAVPNGYEIPDGERVALHSQILSRATRDGVTYRDAVMRVGAEHWAFELSSELGPCHMRPERAELHAQISELALNAGASYREAAVSMQRSASVIVPNGHQVREGGRMELHARILEYALNHGISYRGAIALMAAAETPGVEGAQRATFERIDADVRRTLSKAMMIPEKSLLDRAKRIAEIAESFASAGRLHDALKGIEQAQKVLASAERLADGDTRAGDAWAYWPDPTPETVGKTWSQLWEEGRVPVPTLSPMNH